jgi:hypothetical protein
MFLMTGLQFLLAARAFAGECLSSRGARLELGRRIVNHEAVAGESPDAPFRAGEVVYAHTEVSGHGAGFIEHVWLRDGAEVARHYMPIGPDRRWRTWSRHKLGAGDYVVELYGPDGRRLARHAFTAFPSRRAARA